MGFSYYPQFNHERRALLRNTAVGGALILTGGASKLLAQTAPVDSTADKNKKMAGDKGPPLERGLVQEFVRVSHFDAAAVKQMLETQPALLNASWDWGGGDFEAGIEAASHVGNREIALYFVEKGARPNLFLATMLGHLDIVKGYLGRFPAMINTKGPHGLSLIHHARKGGDEAKEVLAYLQGLGAM